MGENTMKFYLDGKGVSQEEVLKKELERSREALVLLKHKLGPKRLRELLTEETKLGNADFSQWAEASADGKYKEAAVNVEVKGLTKEVFMKWFAEQNRQQNDASLLGANPEHYLIKADGHSQELIETIGFYEHPIHGILKFMPVEQADVPRHEEYDTRMYVEGVFLDSGKDMKIKAMHEFANTDAGMKVRLCVYLPEKTPDQVVIGHQWHLLIEFSNWLNMAYASLK